MISRLSKLYEIKDAVNVLVNRLDIFDEYVGKDDNCIGWLRRALSEFEALPPDQRFFPERRKHRT
jgi:hypothetical protein